MGDVLSVVWLRVRLFIASVRSVLDLFCWKIKPVVNDRRLCSAASAGGRRPTTSQIPASQGPTSHISNRSRPISQIPTSKTGQNYRSPHRQLFVVRPIPYIKMKHFSKPKYGRQLQKRKPENNFRRHPEAITEKQNVARRETNDENDNNPKTTCDGNVGLLFKHFVSERCSSLYAMHLTRHYIVRTPMWHRRESGAK